MKKIFITAVSLISFSMGQLAIASIPELANPLGKSPGDQAGSLLGELESFQNSLANMKPSVLPCDGRISSHFGMRKLGRRRHRMHKGIDIAAPIGTPITAPADGTVSFVGRKGAYGKTIIIKHQGNLSTLFAHNSKILVKEGDSVKKGEIISKVGNTGRSTGPHLHYEVRIDEEQVDPIDFI